jgi:hypothetical protein
MVFGTAVVNYIVGVSRTIELDFSAIPVFHNIRGRFVAVGILALATYLHDFLILQH